MSNSKSDKKVLIIAGEFPPIKTIGRLRTAKFAQHLQSLGWTPIILTLETNASNHDSSLENEIVAGMEIYRVAKPDVEQSIVRCIKSLLKSPPQNDTNNTQEKTATVTAVKQNHPSKSSLKDSAIHIFKQILKYIVYTPDDFNLWAYQAEKIACDICNKHTIDVVYTTLPPFSSCYVGYKIKSKYNIPWVVDYRDLWYGDV